MKTRRFMTLALSLALCLGLALPAAAADMGKVEATNVVSSGDRFTAFLDENGTLWTCGSNRYGQLGIGTHGSDAGSDVPVRVMDGVVSVSCGADFAAAIKTDGSLWTWGYNGYGQLGNNGQGDVEQPYAPRSVCQTTPVKIMDDVAAVSCSTNSTGAYGHGYAAAVKTDGTLWMWGQNFGQFGNGTTVSPYYPVQVMDGVKAVSCGGDFAAILKTDNSLWIAGDSDYGELGNGTYTDMIQNISAYTAVPVKVLDDVASVSCGNNCVAAIKLDGSLWMWGSSRGGRLGVGETGNVEWAAGTWAPLQTVPVKVMEDVAAVSTGGSYLYGCTAVIKTDGSLWMWGSNYRGEQGTGENGGYAYEPHKVLDNAVAVSCGVWCQTAAVTADGSLWTWGDNTAGQLGNGGLGNLSYTTGEMYTVPYRVRGGAALPAGGGVDIPDTVAGFTDVYETAYYADAVEWAVAQGVTGGTSETTFSPGDTVTRAQAMTFLWRAAGSPQPDSTVSPFVDVSPEAYYYVPVLWASENGITGGVSENQFGPEQALTYDQILTFISKLVGESGTGADWSESALNWAESSGLADGLTLSAKGSCPRSDVIYFLWRQLA